MLLSTAVKDHLVMSEASLLDGTNIACIHALPTGPVALGEHIACSDLSAGAVVFERILLQSQGEGVHDSPSSGETDDAGQGGGSSGGGAKSGALDNTSWASLGKGGGEGGAPDHIKGCRCCFPPDHVLLSPTNPIIFFYF